MTMETLLREDDETIAYLRGFGKQPGIVWRGGFKSDMGGTKAEALAGWAGRRDRAYLRFDYFGHGQSSGNFRDGSITRWRDDALAVLDRLCDGPQILVGSSMGAWIALLAARLRPEKIAGLLLLAPAADFTEALIWARMTPEIRREVIERGEWLRPSAYQGGPYPITRALIEDGRRHVILDGAIALSRPVHILQGMQDQDVPWQHTMRLVDRLAENVVLTLIKNGDHRLSTTADLMRIERALERLIAEVGSET
jgi:pimeloyl-ACP methyl ester carboxylesterase